MPLTPSHMLPLGSKVPDFTLLDVISGKKVSLSAVQSPIATVVMFICNHCPYVKHIQAKLVDVAKQYQAKGIVFIGISSNDIESYPDDAPEEMQKVAKEKGYSFPFLFDETQSVAKAYQAVCTPEFYVLNQGGELVYHGRFDDATPGNDQPVTGKELSAALDAILTNQPVNSHQSHSIGCNIKWKNL